MSVRNELDDFSDRDLGIRHVSFALRCLEDCSKVLDVSNVQVSVKFAKGKEKLIFSDLVLIVPRESSKHLFDILALDCCLHSVYKVSFLRLELSQQAFSHL